MNNFLIAIVAVIAAILAAVLFGRPKGETDETPTAIEQVETPSLPPTTAADAVAAPTADPDAVAAPTAMPMSTPLVADADRSESAIGATINEEIADPWAEPAMAEPAAATPPLPGRDAIIPTAQTDAAVSETNAETAGRSMPPFAAIHDPKRPSTPILQDLSQEIVSLGTSRKLSDIPKLIQYRKHSDPMIRCYVAYAIGEIAAAHTVKSDIQAVIPFLGELASDKDLEVQQMAFKALSRIQSPAVLPYLEKGLLSTFGSIKQLANAAIQKLKLQYGDVATATEYPPALQKPSDQA